MAARETGISIMGDTTDMGLGSSSMGNGSVGTSYGEGSTNATAGITTFDGSGFSTGMSSLPAAGGGPTMFPAVHRTNPPDEVIRSWRAAGR